MVPSNGFFQKNSAPPMEGFAEILMEGSSKAIEIQAGGGGFEQKKRNIRGKI